MRSAVDARAEDASGAIAGGYAIIARRADAMPYFIDEC